MKFRLILHRVLVIPAVTFTVGVSLLLAQQVTAKPGKKPRVLFIFGSRKIIAIDAVTRKFKFKGNDGKPGRTQSKLLNEIFQQETFEVSVTPHTELGIKEWRWTPAKQLKAGDHVWYLKKGEDTVIYMQRATITKTRPLTLKIDGHISNTVDLSAQPTFKDFGYLHVPEEGTTKTLVVTDLNNIELRRLRRLRFSDFTVGQYVTVRVIVHPHGKLEADEVYLDKPR